MSDDDTQHDAVPHHVHDDAMQSVLAEDDMEYAVPHPVLAEGSATKPRAAMWFTPMRRRASTLAVSLPAAKRLAKAAR